jgi:adenylate kinase family enzyme
MERVTIIGNSGGGKSRLARRLAARHGLSHYEVDALLWRPGWVLAPAEDYAAAHAALIAGARWVIDGLGRRDSIAARLARADTIMLIDMPLWMHFWLAAERQIAAAQGAVTHPPGGITEPLLTKSLFRTIAEVDRDWMPEIRALVAASERRGATVIRLASVEEIDAFTARL